MIDGKREKIQGLKKEEENTEEMKRSTSKKEGKREKIKNWREENKKAAEK